MKQLFTKIEQLKSVDNDVEKAAKLLRFFSNNHQAILNSANINFKLVTTLLTHIVPHVYLVTEGRSNNHNNQDISKLNELIEHNFYSLVGINNLVNQVSFQNDLPGAQINHHLVQSCMNILLNVIFKNESDNVLFGLLTNEGTLKAPFSLKRNLSDINILFFNNKIFQLISQYYNAYKSKLQDLNKELINKLLDLGVYSEWLNKQYFYLLKNLSDAKLDFSAVTFNLLRITTKNCELALGKILIESIIIKQEQILLELFVKIYLKFTHVSKTQFVFKFLVRLLKSFVQKASTNNLTTESYKVLLRIVGFYFDKFQVHNLNIHNLVIEVLKTQSFPLASSNKFVLVVLLHALVLHTKAKLLKEEFHKNFNTFIKGYWSNEYLIKNQSVSFQESLTVFLVIYLNNIQDENFINSLFANEYFMNATTHHLEQPIISVRYLGIIVAEKISKKLPTGSVLDFHMQESKDFETKLLTVDVLQSNVDELCLAVTSVELEVSYDELRADIKTIMALNSEGHSSQKDTSKQSPSLVLSASSEVIKLSNDKLLQVQIPSDASTEDELDSDDEDYDDPTLAKQNNALPPTPVYLKDLYSYLASHSKENPHQSHLKRRIALENFNRIVRAKRNFKADIEFWSEKLCDALLNLKIDSVASENDKKSVEAENQVKHYNQAKLLGFITLSVVDQLRIPKLLVQQILTGDFSLQDRLLIINSIGLAARELKGFKDEINYKNLKVETDLENFQKIGGKIWPSKKLGNDQSHSRFLLLDENLSGANNPERSTQPENPSLTIESHRLDNITRDITGSINKENKKLIDDKLTHTGQGRLVKISSKLLKERAVKSNCSSQLQSLTSTDQYSTYCLENFISPFLTIWYKLNGDLHTLGNYTIMLITGYLKNLNVLVFCAYPSSINIVEIVTGVFEVLNSLKTIVSGLASAFQNGQNYNAEAVSLNEIAGLLECLLYLMLTVLQLTNTATLISVFQDTVINFFNWLNYLFDNFEDIFGDNALFQNNKSLIANCLLQIHEILQDQLGSIN